MDETPEGVLTNNPHCMKYILLSLSMTHNNNYNENGYPMYFRGFDDNSIPANADNEWFTVNVNNAKAFNTKEEAMNFAAAKLANPNDIMVIAKG